MEHLILINDKFIVCHNNNGVLRIYNSLENFKMEKEIKSIISYAYMHRFSIINSELFCLGGDEYIYLFSITKMDLVNSIKIQNMRFQSIITLPNNTILAGTYENENLCHFFQFQIDWNNQIKEISRKEKVHGTIIWQLINLKNNNNDYEQMISVSDDAYLKKWDIFYE